MAVECDYVVERADGVAVLVNEVVAELDTELVGPGNLELGTAGRRVDEDSIEFIGLNDIGGGECNAEELELFRQAECRGLPGPGGDVADDPLFACFHGVLARAFKLAAEIPV